MLLAVIWTVLHYNMQAGLFISVCYLDNSGDNTNFRSAFEDVLRKIVQDVQVARSL